MSTARTASPGGRAARTRAGRRSARPCARLRSCTMPSLRLRFVVELRPRGLGEQLREADDRAHRRAQVVRNRIAEAFELLVRRLELRRAVASRAARARRSACAGPPRPPRRSSMSSTAPIHSSTPPTGSRMGTGAQRHVAVAPRGGVPEAQLELKVKGSINARAQARSSTARPASSNAARQPRPSYCPRVWPVYACHDPRSSTKRPLPSAVTQTTCVSADTSVWVRRSLNA